MVCDWQFQGILLCLKREWGLSTVFRNKLKLESQKGMMGAGHVYKCDGSDFKLARLRGDMLEVTQRAEGPCGDDSSCVRGKKELPLFGVVQSRLQTSALAGSRRELWSRV